MGSGFCRSFSFLRFLALRTFAAAFAFFYLIARKNKELSAMSCECECLRPSLRILIPQSTRSVRPHTSYLAEPIEV